VRQRQFAVAGGLGLHQPDLGPLQGQPVTQQLVLRHRKAVAGGQRQHELRGVEDLHGAIVRRSGQDGF
jgi:hypothetical protein